MTDMNKDTIENAGFKLGEDGKVRLGGKMISASLASAVASGNVLANFDLAALKKDRQRKAAAGGINMVDALDKITMDAGNLKIGDLKVGMTARLLMPDPEDKRKFIMGIVTKLNNLTYAGREWAGRVFESLSDDKGFLYIMRLADTDTPPERKGSTGRPKGVGNKASKRLEDAMAASRKHFEGEGDNADKEGEIASGMVVEGEAIVIGQEEGIRGVTEGDEAEIEEAVVINH